MRLRELSFTPWLFKSSLCQAFWHRIQSFLSHCFQKAFISICQHRSSCRRPCNKMTKILTSLKKKTKAESNLQYPSLDHCYNLIAARWWDKLPAIPSLQRDGSQPGSQQQRIYTDSWMAVVIPCHSVTFHQTWSYPNRPWDWPYLSRCQEWTLQAKAVAGSR